MGAAPTPDRQCCARQDGRASVASRIGRAPDLAACACCGGSECHLARSGKGAWRTGDHGLSRDGRALPAPEQLRPKLARHRARWKAHQDKVDQSRLVFIDETWIKTNMAPLRGWGPR